MTKETKKVTSPTEMTVEQKLKSLYKYQTVLSKIDDIRTIRGELPLEVQDLEDEIEGLGARIARLQEDLKNVNSDINRWNEDKIQAQTDIERCKFHLDNVRNNREFESLNKEIEFQNLEIQLCERKNKEGAAHVKELKQHIEAAKVLLANREKDLEAKREELTSITAETEKDEERLRKMSKEQEQYIDERYLTAYKRIRNAARNGLAVVTIDRDACGGCFSKIPPQRQTEIKMHKKVIVCEHCGRILVDDTIADMCEI